MIRMQASDLQELRDFKWELVEKMVEQARKKQGE